MKNVKKLFGLLGLMALCACSENDFPDGPGTSDAGDGENHYLAVTISNPVGATPAAYAGSRAQGLDGTYEEGSADENEIKSLRFYFFDKDNNAVNVNPARNVNYVDATVNELGAGSADMDNVEKKFQAVVVINTKKGDNAAVNSMVAVANHTDLNLGTGSLSFKNLCDKVGDYVSTDNGFLMTNSSYADENGQITVSTIHPDNLCSTSEDALKRPIQVYIERVVAKARLKVDLKEGEPVAVDATFEGKTYKAVPLKDKDGKVITEGGKQVYALFKGWDVTGTADKSRLIKKVNSTTSWNSSLGWIWNSRDFFRSFWAVNPDDGLTLGYKAYKNIGLEVGETALTYMLENAADNYSDGTKKLYNPVNEVSNRTQAIIAAVLVTLDGDDNATAVSRAKWAGNEYTEAGLKTAMVNQVANVIYLRTETNKDDGTKEYEFSSIAPEHVELVSAVEAGLADENSEASKRYLSYLNLNKQVAEAITNGSMVFTEGKTKDAPVLTVQRINDELLEGLLGAQVWKEGMTYYYTDFVHHAAAADSKGKYGVVRNHIYDVAINSVRGLGTPVYNPDEEIIPQKPDNDDDTYIAAQINVLSWRVVPNNIDLEW